MPASYQIHRAQLRALLAGWGMPAAYAERTAEVMAWADLHGIDSHGISMIPAYHQWHREGRIAMAARPTVVRETPVSALLDGGGGLGHEPARQAMEIAIAKANSIGIGVVCAKNSAHFGACGFYAKMASDAGLVGFVTTSAVTVQVAPAGGAQARLGTDPLAFAAPTNRPDEPFLLDMATTTVAAGRIRNRATEKLPAPAGWLLTSEGLPSTDPLEAAEKGGYLTSLGGSLEGSSYKGYGLAAMVNILASSLSGARLVTGRRKDQRDGFDIGHFFLAINPTLFRNESEFEDDVTTFVDALRGTRPLDPENPVMIAGDPERRNSRQRLNTGIPVGAYLLEKIKAIAEQSGVDWLLDPRTSGSAVEHSHVRA